MLYFVFSLPTFNVYCILNTRSDVHCSFLYIPIPPNIGQIGYLRIVLLKYTKYYNYVILCLNRIVSVFYNTFFS